MKDYFRAKFKGELTLSLIDSATREVISTNTHRNLIVDSGYKVTAQVLAGVTGAKISSVQVGISSHEPVPNDTDITDSVSVPIVTVEYPDDFSVRFNFEINSGTANGLDIVEFGLTTQDGRLFSRLVREQVISKTTDIEILGAWTIYIK